MKNEYYENIYNTENYYLQKSCEGLEEYLDGKISSLKRLQIRLLNFQAEDRFLDIGCGRGDVACAVINDYSCRVSAIDCSDAAVQLAHNVCQGRADVRKAVVTELPFENDSFNKILIGDVIEHVDQEDSYKMLQEAKRVLAPGGIILIHTCPNVNFIKYIYPLGHLFCRMYNPDLASQIKSQYESREIYHINEYTPHRLIKQCREIGFTCCFKWPWGILRNSEHRLTSSIPSKGFFKILDKLSLQPFFRNFLCNDIFVICQNTSPQRVEIFHAE